MEVECNTYLLFHDVLVLDYKMASVIILYIENQLIRVITHILIIYSKSSIVLIMFVKPMFTKSEIFEL